MTEIPQNHVDFADGLISRLFYEHHRGYSLDAIIQEIAKIHWDRERAIEALESIAHSSYTKVNTLQDIAVDSLGEINDERKHD